MYVQFHKVGARGPRACRGLAQRCRNWVMGRRVNPRRLWEAAMMRSGAHWVWRPRCHHLRAKPEHTCLTASHRRSRMSQSRWAIPPSRSRMRGSPQPVEGPGAGSRANLASEDDGTRACPQPSLPNQFQPLTKLLETWGGKLGSGLKHAGLGGMKLGSTDAPKAASTTLATVEGAF